MTPFSPRLEQLEDRITPSAYNPVWSNSLITVSFAGDTTTIGSQSSNLVSTFGALPPTGLADWQETILEAIQAWASTTGLDVAVVDDDNSAFGTPGRAQGDSRFGDIRIGGISMGALTGTEAGLTTETVGSSVGFDWRTGAVKGEIILNTDAPFVGSGSLDLYSVMLHEFGHSLGLPDKPVDEVAGGSIMFPYIHPDVTDLSTNDVTDIQNLYGQRKDDRFEGTNTGDPYDFTVAARKTLRRKLEAFETEAEGAQDLFRYQVDADIKDAADFDVYTFTTKPATATNIDFKVRLITEDVSLLDAKLTILDAGGAEVASDTTGIDGTVTLTVTGAPADTAYSLVVESATDGSFDVGGYQLQVLKDKVADKPYRKLNGVYDAWLADPFDGADDPTILRKETHSNGGQRSFHTSGRISDANDVDYFRVKSKGEQQGDPLTMTVAIWTHDSTAAEPTIRVFRESGAVGDVELNDELLISNADIESRGDGRLVVRFDSGIDPQEFFYITVRSSDGSAVDYDLAVQFTGADGIPGVGQGGEEIPDPDQFIDANGTIHSDYNLATDTDLPYFFEVAEVSNAGAVKFEFFFELESEVANAETEVRLTFFDDDDNVIRDVFVQLDNDNLPAGVSTHQVHLEEEFFLSAGTYKIRIAGASRVFDSGVGAFVGAPYSIRFELDAFSMSDTLGPQLIDPDEIPPQRETQPAWEQDPAVLESILGGIINLLQSDWFGQPYGNFTGRPY